MFLYCIRRRLQLLGEKLPRYQRNISKYNTRDDSCDKTSLLMQICADRYYISPEAFHTRTCTYGPLGTGLKKNIIEQWSSAIRSRAYVFGITTSVQSRMCEESVRIVNVGTLQEILNQESLTEKEASQKIQTLMKDSVSVRTSLLQGECRPFSTIVFIVTVRIPHTKKKKNLGFFFFVLQGALQQYIQALELVNRTLPFGLAEIGLCHHSDSQHRHSSGW